MRKHRYGILIGLIGLLILATLMVGPASATVVWQDDFNDGNYESWSIDPYDYSFTVVDGACYGEGPGELYAWIKHPSTQTVGQWSFDFTEPARGVSSDHLADFIVMANGSDYTYTGWGIHIDMLRTGTVAIYISSYDGTIHHGRGNLVSYIHDSSINGTWVSFVVTCDASGEMNVFMDDEHILTYSGITYDDSDLFIFNGNWCGFDNVVVNDEISMTTETTTDTTTETTTTTDGTPDGTPIDTTTMLLIAGGGVAVIVVIVVILKMRS
ncbi:MAG: hypothetical protein ACFFDM_13220 [Candidatus Thorarchaeota archaeon]